MRNKMNRFIKADTTVHRPKINKNKLPLIPTKTEKTTKSK